MRTSTRPELTVEFAIITYYRYARSRWRFTASEAWLLAHLWVEIDHDPTNGLQAHGGGDPLSLSAR